MSLVQINNEYSNVNHVYLSTSLEEYKKLTRENMYYEKNGSGRRYWKQIGPKVVIGTSSSEVLDLGKMKDADQYIKQYIICSDVEFDDMLKKRINRLDVDWTFETIDELDQLKSFIDSTYNHMVFKAKKNADKEFKDRYDVNLKPAENLGKDVDFDLYESRLNRYVVSYHIIANDNLTNDLLLYVVKWYDYNSLKYLEEDSNVMDSFIKVATYRLLTY